MMHRNKISTSARCGRGLRDLELQRVEVLTMTRSEFETWRRALGTLAEIVASTGVIVDERASAPAGRIVAA
jgi:hypothetical protein